MIRLTASVCKRCEEPIEDLAVAMLEGCHKCGGKLFKLSTAEDVEVVQTKETEMSKEVSIKVKDAGEYAINLESLLKSESNKEPLLVEDKDGVVRVIFNNDD